MPLDTTHLLTFLAAFGLIALASERVGGFFRRYKLPLITGFLVTGIVAGPYALDLIKHETVRGLHLVDQVSLAVIAFAAGNELYLKELQHRLRSITWLTVGQVAVTFVLGTLAFFLLTDLIPALDAMDTTGHVAVSILAGAILVARSPSSAIAIISELRAKGPFTRTSLGVTVVIDIVVIVLFSLCFTTASGLLTDGFDVTGVVVLAGQVTVAVAAGVAIGWVLHQLLARVHDATLRAAALLLLGWGVFAGAEALQGWSHHFLPFTIHLEPLLICLVASFYLTNHTASRDDLTRVVHRISPPVYVAFFTLTGASLALDVLVDTWHLALILFVVRVIGIVIGTRIGGAVAKDPVEHTRIAWMAYITQAGVALGLAKSVASEFPDWGPAFATTIVALIVLNQAVGPPLLTWAIRKAGEDRSRADPAAFDGVRDALIFGVEGQSLALAGQLTRADWSVRMGCVDATEPARVGDLDVFLHPVRDIDLASLDALEGRKADAIVTLLDDERNLAICELAYQHYGTRTLIARSTNRAWLPRYQELGVLVLDPREAMVSLLERSVRSPASTALMLGMDEGQDLIDVEIGNPDIVGLAVKDIRLPLDVALLYVKHRDGAMISSTGTTRLNAGDRVTLAGPTASLDAAVLKLEA